MIVKLAAHIFWNTAGINCLIVNDATSTESPLANKLSQGHDESPIRKRETGAEKETEGNDISSLLQTPTV